MGNNQIQRNKIKAFGSMWETRLQVLWEDETASLRAIARQLGVDPLTIKRQAARIGLPFPRPVRKCLPLKLAKKISLSPAQASEGAALETYRTTWLKTIQTHPGAGVKILRSMEPSVYAWLYKNDKIWLQVQTPLCKNPKLQSYRVDWEKRDLQIAEEVRIAAILLKNIPGRPVHVTISAIGREIGQLALLQQHLDKLPGTAASLEDLVESREAFAVRRVEWAFMEYSWGNVRPKRWQVVRMAGVERLAEQLQVKEAIDALFA